MANKHTEDSKEPATAAVNHRTIVGRNRRSKTRARIIEAALHVFAEKGPDAPVIDDFIRASGIARGTFYNYFNNTAELLTATSTWLTDDMAAAIEGELQQIKDPVIRHGTGIRLWMRKASIDSAWCGFVATVWFQGGFALEGPLRDIGLGMKSGDFSCPSAMCGWDLTMGGLRQAMLRLLNEPKLIKTNYAEQMVDIILQGLGASRKKRDEVFAFQLPEIRRPTKTLT